MWIMVASPVSPIRKRKIMTVTTTQVPRYSQCPSLTIRKMWQANSRDTKDNANTITMSGGSGMGEFQSLRSFRSGIVQAVARKFIVPELRLGTDAYFCEVS